MRVRKKLSFLIVMAVSFILCAQPLHVRADDGGDGGSGDGGSSDGSGTDGGTGTDSTGTDGTGNGGTDGTSADDASNGDATTAGAPSTDPTVAQSVDAAPAPTVEDVESPLDAIQAIATTDPRGGFAFLGTNIADAGPDDAIPTGAPAAPVDVVINAVVVSGAQSPWDAITKAPGVRNVIVTGGVIAMGKTPIEGEIPGGGPQPGWLRLIPDLRLLNGSMIPPVVPNVIDIRTLSCPIKIEDMNVE
jgi:hypothetical protein